MQKLQQGFTLIELMIVVAIIGILAALAVPAYQDYTIRAKVSEAASLSGAAKTAVEVYYSETGSVTLPGTAGTTRHTALGIAQNVSWDSKYVNQLTVQDTAANVAHIAIALKTTTPNELGECNGDTIDYYAHRNQGANLQWTVSSAGCPAKYWPRT